MTIKYILIGIAFLVIGMLVMWKYKFYKYPKTDMLFATKFKVFLGGLLSFLVGIMLIIASLCDMVNG